MLCIEEQWYADHHIGIQILGLLVQVGALGQVSLDVGLIKQIDQLFGLVVDRRTGQTASSGQSDVGALTAVKYERVEVVGGVRVIKEPTQDAGRVGLSAGQCGHIGAPLLGIKGNLNLAGGFDLRS